MKLIFLQVLIKKIIKFLMAKKSSSDLTFKDVSGFLDTISKKNSIIFETNKNKRTYINTGIYILNALLSKSILHGGVTKNRITIFAGPTGVGKSYLCYNIAKHAQKDGYNILFIDTEFSAELEDFEAFGIDVSDDRFKLVRTNKVEDLKIFLTQYLDHIKQLKNKNQEYPKTIIFLDSIGQLASTKEIEDALKGENKVDMSRAKAIKSLFRIINSDLGYLSIPLISTNHIYLTNDLFPTEKMSGGEGANYSASTIIYLAQAKLKTGEEDELDLNSSGVLITAKSRKNRLAKPKKVKFEIDHSKGTNKYTGLDFFCTPENFEKIGIAKVKPELDKKTGEITYKESNRWYIKHLDKSLFEKQIFNSKVFTEDILKKLEPIIFEYFSYVSQDEIDKIEEQMNQEYQEFEITEETSNENENDVNNE
jgi:RecA/RadA recombinase